jgi:hypothetical protein
MYYDFDSFEEIQIQTGGSDASLETGGVNINFITKSGSNTLRGSGRFMLVDQAVQSSNVTAELKSMGAGAGNPVNVNFNSSGALTTAMPISPVALTIGGGAVSPSLFTFRHRVFVHLHFVDAIFQRVSDAHALVRQLALLADRDETRGELMRHRTADDEAAYRRPTRRKRAP